MNKKTVLYSLGLLAALGAQAAVPNVVILYADDMGYGDLKANRPESKIQTPHFDQLASDGMRFTDGHSSSGVCTPSRFALLTGQHHWRRFHGIASPFSKSKFLPSDFTLPELFKNQGYSTACIGKWHLGWNWQDIATTKSKLKRVVKPEQIDSYNLLPLLKGEAYETPLRIATVQNTYEEKFALRQGDWMYIDVPTGSAKGEPESVRKTLGYTDVDSTPGLLYNLKDDLSQHYNLYAKYPEKVQEMKALLDQYRAGKGCAPHACGSKQE